MENNKLHPILTDFRQFLCLVWEHLHLSSPTPIQHDIAHFLQHGPRRCVIEAFRGVGKSWITSAFVCWSLLRNPQLNILVVSASKQRADDFSTFTRRLIYELPVLYSIRPRDNQRDANIAFDVGPAKASQAPSVKSIGITGQITGSRADIVIADDVEVLNNSQTPMMREKLLTTIKEFEAVIKPGGRIIFLGTPQTEMSIYHHLEESGYTTRLWPARTPANDKLSSYGNRLAPYVKKLMESTPELTPTDLKRFSDLELTEREVVYGKTGFALQFMLDTSLSDANKYPLKLSDLIVMDVNSDIAPVKVAWCSSYDKALLDLPTMGLYADRFYAPLYISDEWDSYTGSIMTIDPSGRGQDETGYAVVKMLKGYLFLTASGGLKGGYSQETIEALAKIAKEQQVNLIQIESNFGDGMFTQLFKPILHKHHNTTVEEIRHSTQKERRIIDTLEPVMNQHRLIIDKRLIRQDFESTPEATHKLFYQMTRITKDRGALAHDDRLEAVAMAVSYWVDQMAKDTERNEQEHKEKLLEVELERFRQSAIGKSNNCGLQWISIV
ncbi:MAG: phage terminase large subunit [Alphaproteobacteria bacterium]|nr:phage terminase large subunit [Alphaproteobacteria bacterium]OJV45216.1 MAG: DNA maturase B [Alphaproteobacteria bacterium 43-37]